MNRFFYTIVLLISIVSCTSGHDTEIIIQTEDIPLSIRETDSIVVKTLIDRSETFYSDNLITGPVFDDFLKEAEEISVKNNFRTPLSSIYHTLEVRYRNRSEYANAIKYADKAIEIGRNLNDNSRLANYINMAAVVYRRVDENKQALEMHMEAMELAESVGDSFQIAVSLNGIGNVYLGLKRHHASVEYFKKSFQIAVARGNVLGQAINSNNIGEALKLANDLDSALVYFYQSLDYNTQLGSKVGQAICYNSIGDAYRLKKDYSQALKYLKRALILNKETRDRINVSTSYSMLGETYIQVYDYYNAINNLKSGLQIAQEIGSKYQIEACSKLLALAYEKTNALSLSIKHLRMAQVYKDSLFDEANLRHITVVTARHESDKAKAQIQQLNNESTLQKKLISQQKKAILYFSFFVLALIAAGVLIFRQIRLNEGYKSILMQQRLLRSQMNPHFIFNALSAIQVYILENDMENSSRFLSDFARLMRQVLQSSQRDYVSLEEERSMITYYLKLQQLRFNPPFSYEIVIDESLDKDRTLIPPMITQPFVENAVEHGIKSIGKHGKVTVRFTKSRNDLVVIIEDNGIGLAGSQVLKTESSKHQSMATQITNERLEVIQKMTKRNTSFRITDLQDNSENQTGVLVKIRMPLINPDTKLKTVGIKK
ncbi:tetratricopeptide repeat-containing sensor histidine kinase [Labilibacter marinus]|uniref:tetratricopeptide repeat-containing sensor histidine kinase n=1 Tax=Labilibacter marinus TaxID=1477105 RepID=UPI00094F6985|nr:tetratricopeptide repeat protein [Labilibacter marinus]